MTRHLRTILEFSLLALVGCAPKYADYSSYLRQFPRSVLVLPPINESLEVQASGMFLSTVTTLLAERGYYVLPVAVVDAVLKENGVPLPPEMHQVPLSKLRDVFGADAVLFVTIKQWTTTYVVLNASTSVTLAYRLVDADSGDEIWRWQQAFHYSPSIQQNSLVGMLVSAAVHAVESTSGRMEREVAIAANYAAFNSPTCGLLTGARHPDYERDLETAQRRQQMLERQRTHE